MTVPTPQLDDRRWEDLVAGAKAYLGEKAPGWTDHSPGDPGMVLVELFAYLTELMIYRLNRVPDKAYLEFLKLMGLTLRPPAAASAKLRFEADQAAKTAISIPRGTRATVKRAGGSGEPPMFVTAEDASVASGDEAAEVLALQCELVDGELLGHGTGLGGQLVTVQRPPIIAPTGTQLDLVVGVEAQQGEFGERVAARDHDGRTFVIWEEVDNFANRSGDDRVYVADRMSGEIVFAPTLRRPDSAEEQLPMAAVPAADREIRAWYARGGGAEGNLIAEAIAVLKDPMSGVRKVSNPEAATGGRPAETLDEALVRGPQELHGIERAVTAQDYEAVARWVSGAIARARAFTEAALWRHAAPGTVEVLIVPYVDQRELGGGHLSAEVLHEHEADAAEEQIQEAIDQRRPLGTACLVNWASYKTVRIKARVVVRREEDLGAVKGRVEDRLYATINPLPNETAPGGWRFGQALRASHVFDMALKEPGVRFVDSVHLLVDFAPNADVKAVAADAFQPHAWYAASGGMVFRSLNDAEGWEALIAFEGEVVERIHSHPEQPGLVAVVTSVAKGSRLHFSFDAGETWDLFAAPKLEFDVANVAWSMKGSQPTLLIASDVGLYELAVEAEASPVQVLVTPDQTQGFYAVGVAVDALGSRNVAVAAQETGGVWLSSEGGAPSSFRKIGLVGEDIRVLSIQRDGPRAFLWAAAAAAGGDDPGKGAWRWELRGGEDPPEGWVPFGRKWSAGSCWGLAFQDSTIFAATHHGGVLHLDARRADASWAALDVNSGLPLRDPTKFLFAEVDDVAAGGESGLILAGGAKGVYGSTDGSNYQTRCETEFAETVSLPETWLFVSGEHEITVVSEGDLD